MEFVYSRDFPIETVYVDRFGRLKPSMILYFAQEVATDHCVQLGCDWDAMAAKGLFWAVMRHRIEITKLPMVGQMIRIETWPMPTTRTAYPRSMVAYDAQGNLKPQFQGNIINIDCIHDLPPFSSSRILDFLSPGQGLL